MIKFVTIYGERCSGTNFLEQSLIENFDVEVTWKYGWKHFFGFNSLENSDDTLFLGIVRDGYQWMNSLKRQPWHLDQRMLTSTAMFLSHPVISYELEDDKITLSNREIKEDYHMHEPHRHYHNLFELRQVKTEFLMKIMPRRVKHYLFMKYEDLLTRFRSEMDRIATYVKVKRVPYVKPYWYKNHRRTLFRERQTPHMPIQKLWYYHHASYVLIKKQEYDLGYAIKS